MELKSIVFCMHMISCIRCGNINKFKYRQLWVFWIKISWYWNFKAFLRFKNPRFVAFLLSTAKENTSTNLISSVHIVNDFESKPHQILSACLVSHIDCFASIWALPACYSSIATAIYNCFLAWEQRLQYAVHAIKED